MATLTVLGSGSKGNAFVVGFDGELLLLDAGFSLKEVERRMRLAGLDPHRVVGVALTHEHGDHACGAVAFAKRYRIPITTSFGTWTSLTRGGDPCDFHPAGFQQDTSLGCFTIAACPTSHDATEPIALGIRLPDGTSIGVAYDLGRPTQAVRWFLRDRHCLVLEANHDEHLLRTSTYPLVVQQRIAGPGGHLSNHDAARLLAELHHDELELVVLAHLSQRCNNHETAHGTVHAALHEVGYRGALMLAEQDGPMIQMTINGPRQRALVL